MSSSDWAYDRDLLPLKDNVPTRSFPVVTVALIAANVLVYLWEVSSPGLQAHVQSWGYYPCAVEGPCTTAAAQGHHEVVETVFSSMFMHGGLVHIGGNMLFLWIFGNNVEDSMGRVRFLLWYLAAGLAAIAAQTIVTLQFSNNAGASVPNVGASGAIAGVLGAYFVLLPQAIVLVLIFFFLREIPAMVFLGIWFVFQLWDGGFAVLHPQAAGDVAFFAHVGGFLFGVATVRLVVKRRPLRPAW